MLPPAGNWFTCIDQDVHGIEQHCLNVNALFSSRKIAVWPIIPEYRQLAGACCSSAKAYFRVNKFQGSFRTCFLQQVAFPPWRIASMGINSGPWEFWSYLIFSHEIKWSMEGFSLPCVLLAWSGHPQSSARQLGIQHSSLSAIVWSSH